MTVASLMAGKTVLITGGTGGIGRAAAIGLASMGARVGITGRDQTRAERAAVSIARESGNLGVDVFVGDMSSQEEVRRLADEVLSTYPRLDVLVNNVGGFWSHRHVTVDGLEHTFALNHLAPLLLTSLLLERLLASAPARVVNVSSGAQSMGRIDFDDLMGEQDYSGQTAYNQSKLANVMFTYELARLLDGSGVTVNVLHPGMTNTAFSAEDPARKMAPVVAVMRPFMRSPKRGREHRRAIGKLLRGGRCHRPILRESKTKDIQQVLIRHGDNSPSVGRQRRSGRPTSDARALVVLRRG